MENADDGLVTCAECGRRVPREPGCELRRTSPCAHAKERGAKCWCGAQKLTHNSRAALDLAEHWSDVLDLTEDVVDDATGATA